MYIAGQQKGKTMMFSQLPSKVKVMVTYYGYGRQDENNYGDELNTNLISHGAVKLFERMAAELFTKLGIADDDYRSERKMEEEFIERSKGLWADAVAAYRQKVQAEIEPALPAKFDAPEDYAGVSFE